MAYPVVTFNLDEGADPPAASGAGPATAVTGTKARTRNYSETRIGFFETSAPDLSGVPTDGSAVLALGTVSGREFSRITAVKDTAASTTGDATISSADLTNVADTSGLAIGDVICVTGIGPAGADLYTKISNIVGSTVIMEDAASTAASGTAITDPKQVSVANTFTLTSDTTWATGGKLQDLTAAAQLFADLSAGWTVKIEKPASAGVYDLTGATITLAVSSTTGRIVIEGSGRPTVKGDAFALQAAGYHFRGFDFQDCTDGIAVSTSSAGDTIFERIGGRTGITDAVDFAATATGYGFRFIGCDFRNMTGNGINVQGELGSLDLYDHISVGGIGVNAQAGIKILTIRRSIFSGGNYGVILGSSNPCFCLVDETIFDGMGNGFSCASALVAVRGMVLTNSIFSNCSGTGLSLPSGADAAVHLVDGNDFWNNAIHRTNISAGPSDISVDPQYFDAANLDFRVGLGLEGQGLPVAGQDCGAAAVTPTSVDIGVQRLPTIGGQYLARIVSLDSPSGAVIAVEIVGGLDDGQGFLVHLDNDEWPAESHWSEKAFLETIACRFRDVDGHPTDLVGKEVRV